MLPDEDKRQEMRAKATARWEEVASLLTNKDQSLVQLLVRLYRYTPDADRQAAATRAYDALHQMRGVVDEAVLLYEAAIAQPEPRVTTRRVEL